MARRHGRTPPYEIMQHVGSGTPLPRSGMRRVRGGSTGLLGVAWAGVSGGFAGFWVWLVGLGKRFRGNFPENHAGGAASGAASGGTSGGDRSVALQLPWPVWTLLGVVALAALGLMFQIGHHMAGRSQLQSLAAATDPAETPQNSENKKLTPDTGPVDHPGVSHEKPDTVIEFSPSRVQPLGDGGVQDPRLPGLNYFVLATVRTSEVNGVWALQEFLDERGVATYLDHANNGRFRVLVDVTRGFTRDELRNLEHAEHERYIRSLGREWKKSQGGLGTDLSDLYRDRYDGPPAPGTPGI